MLTILGVKPAEVDGERHQRPSGEHRTEHEDEEDHAGQHNEDGLEDEKGHCEDAFLLEDGVGQRAVDAHRERGDDPRVDDDGE